MERTIVLVRHAQAAPADDDAARQLTGSGLADARALGHELPRIAPPDVYSWVSAAVRARQTWAAIAAGSLTGRVEVDVTADLYPVDVDDAVDLVRRTPSWARTAVVVGHNPGIANLASGLHDGTGTGAWTELERQGFPPCAAVALAYEGGWSVLGRGAAQVRWTWAPPGR